MSKKSYRRVLEVLMNSYSRAQHMENQKWLEETLLD